MKRLAFIFIFIFAVSLTAFAQKQIEPQVQRDPLLEADSKRNLEVALHYFKLKKAYRAVLMRCEEIIAANPDFSRMDAVLYLSGMSSYYLAEGKGKQKLILKTEEEKKRFAPEKLKEDAVAYLSQLKENFPQSEYIGETEKALKELEKKSQP
jgi:outer membrane protein assembly factor BamD (BamD/ComL family)